MKQGISVALVIMLLFSGCLSNDDTGIDKEEEILIEDTETSETENSNETVNQTVIVKEPELIEVPYEEGCDNINPLHCMLPFPSNAFLSENSTTETGFRVNYADSTFPEAGIVYETKIPGLSRLDGMSPATQIMTAFEMVPDLDGVANQSTISRSLESGHKTILLNLDTGEIIPHWVEIDMRADDDFRTLLYIRTLRGLDHNADYGIGITGLTSNGTMIEPSLAFKAMIEGNLTTATDIEDRRDSFEELFAKLEVNGYPRLGLQAAWRFHTASTESIIGGMLHMREDTLERIGDGGIGCNVTSVEDNYGDDNLTFRRIRGTFTAPQYLENYQEPPTIMVRDDEGNPVFKEYGEVPFTVIIPQSLADRNVSGPLIVFGHGFLGNGHGAISGGAREWAQQYNISFIASDFYGWSSSDMQTIQSALIDVKYFEHQADRLQQAMVNKITMARTFKGVCSAIPEFYNDGTNLVNTEDVHYMGYSLGGIYGPALVALSPDIDRGVFWVGGSAFSTMIERSTHYYQFELVFSHDVSYPERIDRAILISVAQQLWDSTDPESYFPFITNGYGDVLGPNHVVLLDSVNDAQVAMLSSDRAGRTANIPILNTSSRIPYGMDVDNGPVNGSAMVYFDGNFPGVPEGNLPPPSEYHSLAHNSVATVPESNELVFQFLSTGIITNTCDNVCDYEFDW